MSRLSLRDSITIILLILITFGLSFGSAQYTARKEIQSICDHKTEQDLNYMLTSIDKELGMAEQAAKTFCAVVFSPGKPVPDSTTLYKLQEQFMMSNPNVSSIIINFESRVFPQYCADSYAQMVRSSDHGLEHRTFIDSPSLRNLDWYSIAVHKDERRWCKPFIPEMGITPVTSYSHPIYSDHNHIVGVVGVSLRLSRLDSILNVLKPFPDAVYTVVLNRDLTYIVHPIKDMVLNMNLKQEHEALGDPLSDEFLTRLGDRQRGKEKVVWEGRKKTVYYAPIDRAECSALLSIDDETTFHAIAPNQKYRIILSSIGLLITFAYLMVLVRRNRSLKQRND